MKQNKEYLKEEVENGDKNLQSNNERRYKKMRKDIKYIVAGLVVVAIALVLILALSGEKEIVRIGATFPMTGELGTYGQAFKEGVLLAQKEINDNNGINGKKFEVILADNKGDPTTVVSDVNYLINVENVPVILNSAEYLTMASYQISETAKKVMISAMVYQFSEQDNPKYTFKNYWGMEDVGKSFGDALVKIRSNKVAIIGQQDSSLVALKNGFESRADIIAEETFSYGSRDFKTQLIKLRQANPDTIVVYALPVEASIILKQMAELGMDNYKLLITEGSEIWVLQGNEDILQKTKAITYLGAKLDENEKSFIDKYKAEYGSFPRPEAFFAYESTKMTAEAMKFCDDRGDANDADCIKQQIAGNFDNNHNRVRTLPLVQYDNGWKLFE